MKVHHCSIALRHVMLLALLVVASAGVVHAQSVPTGTRQLDQVHAEAGVKCASCHVTAARSAPVRMATCLSCHGSGTALAARTAQFKPTNPHHNPHYGTETDCNLCHHQHQASVDGCSGCHTRFEFKVP